MRVLNHDKFSTMMKTKNALEVQLNSSILILLHNIITYKSKKVTFEFNRKEMQINLKS